MDSLREDAAAFGVSLTDAHDAAFAQYAEALAAWNAHTNLTAITAPADVRVRHFLDSLSLAPWLHTDGAVPAGLRVADVGTGAGFPGLPLKIAYPQIALTLIEATGKKTRFLEHTVGLLGLAGVHVVHARAEEAGHMPALRAAFDVVTARAVARLPVLLEYLLPLARVGGLCIALKGHTAFAEAESSTRALHMLGGEQVAIDPVALPGVEEPHYLVVVRKTAPTPPLYPRTPGTPSQKPL
jgi:16S rRNA (guanine527-N7)-methyltransferase